MNDRQKRTHSTLHRAVSFLDSLKDQPPLLAKKRDELNAAAIRLSDLAVQQEAARREIAGSAARLAALRQHIRRERMMPLIRVAKPLLKFAANTEKALHVPHKRATAQTIAAAAVRLSKVLTPHKRLLVEAGCDKTVLSDFRSEATTLAAAVSSVTKVRQKQSRATASVRAEIAKVMQTLTVVDGILMMRLKGDKTLLGVWQSERRVKAKTGRPRARKEKPLAQPLS